MMMKKSIFRTFILFLKCALNTLISQKKKLWMIEETGHSASEPGIEAQSVRAAREFE